MRTSLRWWGAAAAVSGLVAVAVVPMVTLDRALDSYMEAQARERLAVEARGALALAELRLGQATNILIDLAGAGVDDCGPQATEALRLAVFTTTPLKGLSILDPQGRALCSNAGMIEEPHAVSREYSLNGERITLAVARFRERPDRAVRLRLDRPSGRSLAALVAADALLPDFELDPGNGSRRMRLTLENGEVIMIRPRGEVVEPPEPGETITVQQASVRYPISILAERSVRTLARDYGDVQFLARLSAGIVIAFVLGVVLLFARRKREDPVAALRNALRDGEIVPFFQPSVDIVSGRVRGAEVLARWRRRDGTIVSPAHFIPLAEQSGLIFDLTRVLMKRACEEVGTAYASRPGLRLAFNLFAGHFADTRIVEDVRTIFHARVSTQQVVLEVTERAPLTDLGAARDVIAELQSLGIKVAIDDVGTGHGGLSYLLKLGVDIIKIDKMFVDAISTERYSQTIIETLVELGRTMGMEVVAEGVETLEQVEYLRARGVTEAQGYVFAPPLPASSYLALVEAMERPRPSEGREEPLALAGAA